MELQLKYETVNLSWLIQLYPARSHYFGNGSTFVFELSFIYRTFDNGGSTTNLKSLVRVGRESRRYRAGCVHLVTRGPCALRIMAKLKRALPIPLRPSSSFVRSSASLTFHLKAYSSYSFHLIFIKLGKYDHWANALQKCVRIRNLAPGGRDT